MKSPKTKKKKQKIKQQQQRKEGKNEMEKEGKSRHIKSWLVKLSAENWFYFFL